MLIRLSIRQIDMWCGRSDEVLENVGYRGWGLDVGEVPDAAQHFKPAIRYGGVAVGDGNDSVLVTPDQQGEPYPRRITADAVWGLSSGCSRESACGPAR